MNLSELSDYEINKLVAEIKYPGALIFKRIGMSRLNEKRSCAMVSNYGPFNWACDDALAFRLMAEMLADELISVHPECVYARINNEDVHIFYCSIDDDSKELRRAICEVFILMNQGGDK